MLSNDERASLERRVLVSKFLLVGALLAFVLTWVFEECWSGGCAFYAPYGVPIIVAGVGGLVGYLYCSSQLVKDDEERNDKK